jgi:uncharacterized protein (TIGR02594 family)
MSSVPAKVLVAITVGSAALLLAAPSQARPNPRDAEGARIETERTAHLRHARMMREVARRSQPPGARASGQRPRFGWPTLVTEARKYIGTNPTALQRRWCARFLNLVLTKTGYRGTNSDAARSFASYGRRINEPRIGAIAVLSRGKNRNQGHVGIVTGVDANGNPVIISGNHGKRVGESVYPRSRVIAYVMPADGPPMTAVASATPRRDSEPAGLTSPIAELLAAINAETSSRPQAGAPTVQLAAQARQRQPEPQPLRPRMTQRAMPTPRAVPQPKPAPYRVVQQAASRMPAPDPRRVVVR